MLYDIFHVMTINRETVPYFHGVRKNENYLSFLW